MAQHVPARAWHGIWLVRQGGHFLAQGLDFGLDVLDRRLAGRQVGNPPVGAGQLIFERRLPSPCRVQRGLRAQDLLVQFLVDGVRAAAQPACHTGLGRAQRRPDAGDLFPDRLNRLAALSVPAKEFLLAKLQFLQLGRGVARQIRRCGVGGKRDGAGSAPQLLAQGFEAAFQTGDLRRRGLKVAFELGALAQQQGPLLVDGERHVLLPQGGQLCGRLLMVPTKDQEPVMLAAAVVRRGDEPLPLLEIELDQEIERRRGITAIRSVQGQSDRTRVQGVNGQGRAQGLGRLDLGPASQSRHRTAVQSDVPQQRDFGGNDRIRAVSCRPFRHLDREHGRGAPGCGHGNNRNRRRRDHRHGDGGCG